MKIIMNMVKDYDFNQNEGIYFCSLDFPDSESDSININYIGSESIKTQKISSNTESGNSFESDIYDELEVFKASEKPNENMGYQNEIDNDLDAITDLMNEMENLSKSIYLRNDTDKPIHVRESRNIIKHNFTREQLLTFWILFVLFIVKHSMNETMNKTTICRIYTQYETTYTLQIMLVCCLSFVLKYPFRFIAYLSK